MTVASIIGVLHDSYSCYSHDPTLSIQHVVFRCNMVDHTVTHVPRKPSAVGQDGICFAHHPICQDPQIQISGRLRNMLESPVDG